ncbi:26974_t:CDS:1, partial [Dentiscutata erythropus]
CKEWKNVLDNHVFWENLIEHLEFEGPNPKSKKYKTYKSIFVKNVNKLCWCKKNIGEVNRDLKKIETKLSVLYDFYLDRLGFYKSWVEMKYTRSEIYYNLCNYMGEKIFNIYNQCEYKKRCNLCNNQQNILKQIQKLIDNIYEKKNSIKKINKFVVSDLIEV